VYATYINVLLFSRGTNDEIVRTCGKFIEATEVMKMERIKLPADANPEEDDKLLPSPCLAKLNRRSNVAEAP
jgi:hypothetical protein